MVTELTKRVEQTIRKHFVTLSCVQHPPANSPEKLLVFSGFIIDVSNEWFYITAGHILRDINTALAAGSLFDVWRLGDQAAGNQFNDTAVPYEFDSQTWLAIYDEVSGLDYAAVHLSNFYRRQLEVGGVIAIPKNSWGDHVTEYDH